MAIVPPPSLSLSLSLSGPLSMMRGARGLGVSLVVTRGEDGSGEGTRRENTDLANPAIQPPTRVWGEDGADSDPDPEADPDADAGIDTPSLCLLGFLSGSVPWRDLFIISPPKEKKGRRKE